MRPPRSHRFVAPLASLLLAALAVACHPARAHSPEAAFQLLGRAVAARDVDRLFQILDEGTRRDAEGAYRYESEMAGLVESSYPAGPDRDRLLRELDAASKVADGHELFVVEARGRDPFVTLAPATGSGFTRMTMRSPETSDPRARADVLTGSGVSLPFVENDGGTWGYAGFAEIWHERMIRDSHEISTVKENARLYGEGGKGGGGRRAAEATPDPEGTL